MAKTEEQVQKRTLADCLKRHEGEESVGLAQIGVETGLNEREISQMLGSVGVDCRFCVAQCVGGKWSTLLSPEFWD
jgi:hypothetical protein